MNTVPLGRSPYRLARLSLGTTTFGREIDELTSRDLLDYALANGINLLDTAEAYGGGNSREYRRKVLQIDDVREVSGEMHSSEKIIGRWMAERKCRDRVVICTKCSTGGTPAQIKAAVAASLARLQTDYIDIYMLHRPFPGTPILETLEALTAEVQAGRIRTLGCSNFSAERLREATETARAFGLSRFESTQPPFNLADAAARDELLPYCRKEEIATITYSPLAAGFLAGKYSSGSAIPKGTRFDVVPGHIDVYFNDRNFHVLDRLRQLSQETGRPMVSLAMAWVLQHPGVSSVLIGARHRGQIDNAIAALALPVDAALNDRMSEWLYEAYGQSPRLTALAGAINHPRF